eukprot:jgi/Chlat1/4672/Chrsp3S00441
MRLAICIGNPNHHITENILHEAAVQLPEFRPVPAPAASRTYTESQVNEALALFHQATFRYLQVPLPPLSLLLEAEEIRVTVYGRKYVYHRTLLNVDEVDPKHQPEFRDQVLYANANVYVGAHGANGALSIFLPRCAIFLQIASECARGLWSAAPTHAKAIGLTAGFANCEKQHDGDEQLGHIQVTSVAKDFSDYFGHVAGSDASSTCAGLSGDQDVGFKLIGIKFTPDFVVNATGVAEWVAAAVRDWFEKYNGTCACLHMVVC